MDLQAEKLSVLQKIINSNDASLIRDINTLLKTRNLDWFDELDTKQQNDILEGIEQLDKGESFSHEEARKRFSA